MKSSKKRSPLKAKPLHYPGQSIEERIQDLLVSLGQYIFTSLMILFLALYEWMRLFLNNPPNPYLISIVAILYITFSVFKVTRIWQEINRLKLARDGEKIVGQYLDQHAKDARLLHDITGDGFNIDHVIIAPQGIFVVDTKTYSKPASGEAKIVVAGDRVLVNGYEIDRNPLDQVRALSRWLRELLEQSTGKKFPVRPVVLFPGWFVEPRKPAQEVWVLNPKALPAFIAKEPSVLAPSDVQLAFFHLSRYARAHY